MKGMIQIGIGLFTVAVSLVLIGLMAMSEFKFMDLTFGLYFGIFATIAGVAFFALLRNPDNEETDPAKEVKKK